MLSPLSNSHKVGIRLLKFYTLVFVLFTLNVSIMFGFSLIGVNIAISQPIASLALYVLNFKIQKHVVFK